jgi:hypothetical protein
MRKLIIIIKIKKKIPLLAVKPGGRRDKLIRPSSAKRRI